jgi:death on curing protein
MDEPIWLSAATVEAMHDRLLAEHGGLQGVREPGGVESAMARPKQLFAYGEPPPDLAALATAYAGGFIRNHPFVDGNKRMGFASALTFLRLNGWTVAVDQLEAHRATVALATRETSEEAFAAWIRSHLSPWKGRFG